MIDGTTVLAATESQQGPPEAGLAGWDAETGKRSWVAPADRASSLFDETAPSATSLTPGETLWITLKPDPQHPDDKPTVIEVDNHGEQAIFATIDPASGETTRSLSVRYRTQWEPNPSGTLALEDQGNGVLVLELENLLQVIDVQTGELLGWRNWPGN